MVQLWALILVFWSQIVMGQDMHSQITREEATEEALRLVLSDSSSPESPLAIVRACFGAKALSDKAARLLLKEQLEKSSTRFSLYTGTEENIPSPEFGEDPEANWIFLLEIPSLSDHYFWIVINKKRERASSVYGFN